MNATIESCCEMIPRTHAMWNENVMIANVVFASVMRTTNGQALSANGSRDALTHPRSRRAYHGLL
jgi:hypothetical protein